MPRLTRAALRAQETDSRALLVHEDKDIAKLPPSPATDLDSQSTEHSARPVLQELTGNEIPIPTIEQASKTAKGRPGKKGAKSKQDKSNLSLESSGSENNLLEVLDDETLSEPSSAADAAADELRKDEPVPETFQVPMDMDRPHTPPSAAVKETQRSLNRTPTKSLSVVIDLQQESCTPRFDPEVHLTETENCRTEKDAEKSREDSFVESIETRSPTKNTQSPEEQTEEGPDSFVEDIITRSPIKQAKRIEDTVEELDAMEDAFEKVTEGLHKLDKTEWESPVKTRTSVVLPTLNNPSQKMATPKSEVENEPTTNFLKSNAAFPAKFATGDTEQCPRKSLPSQTSITRTTAPLPKPSSNSKPNTIAINTSAKLTSLSTSASTAKAATIAPTRKRVTSAATHLSTSKPGFVPNKSTKPLTKSSFVLPGEAVAAKLKEQREERLRREEEAAAEKNKKADIEKVKAHPKAARISSVGLPRENVANKTRLSMMATRKASQNGVGKENIAPVDRLPSTAPVRKSLAVEKRQSSVASANKKSKDRSISDNVASIAKANSSARRFTTIATSMAKSSSPPPVFARTPAAPATKPTVSNPTTLQRKARGKEIFGRDRLEQENAEKAKKEKEEAAKKARAEAAERGRIASREWAERQKKKILRKVVEEQIKVRKDAEVGVVMT